MQPESDAWVMECTVTISKRVIFDRSLTKLEAMEAMMDGDYEDIIDEEEIRILGVHAAEVMG